MPVTQLPAYDGARRLTQETQRLASGGLTRHVEHTYDGHGNRTQTDLSEALGAEAIQAKQ